MTTNYILFGIVFAITLLLVERIYAKVRDFIIDFKRYKTAQEISFDSFLKSYRRSQDDWDIDGASNLCVCFNLDRGYYRYNRRAYDRKLYFCFNPEDYRKFRKWKKQNEIESLRTDYAKVFADIYEDDLKNEISEVQYDMDKSYQKEAIYIYQDCVTNTDLEAINVSIIPILPNEIESLRKHAVNSHSSMRYYIRDYDRKIDYTVYVESTNRPVNPFGEDYAED